MCGLFLKQKSVVSQVHRCLIIAGQCGAGWIKRERGGSSEVGTAEWCARLAGGGFLFKPLTFQAPAGWTILFQEPGPGVDYSFSPF